MNIKVFLLIIVVMIYGCSAKRDDDSTKKEDTTINKNKLSKNLEVFCETETQALQKDDSFRDIVLSYSVDNKEAEIAVSGTVKNEEEEFILRGLIYAFLPNSGVPPENIKIRWNVTKDRIK